MTKIFLFFYIFSSTIETGWSLFVKIIFGYIAATSTWYSIGKHSNLEAFSCLVKGSNCFHIFSLISSLFWISKGLIWYSLSATKLITLNKKRSNYLKSSNLINRILQLDISFFVNLEFCWDVISVYPLI